MSYIKYSFHKNNKEISHIYMLITEFELFYRMTNLSLITKIIEKINLSTISPLLKIYLYVEVIKYTLLLSRYENMIFF